MKSLLLCSATALIMSAQALATPLCFEKPASLKINSTYADEASSLPDVLRIDSLKVQKSANGESALVINGPTINGTFKAQESKTSLVSSYSAIAFKDYVYSGICRLEKYETLEVIATTSPKTADVKVIGHRSFTIDNCHIEADVITDFYKQVACK